MLQAVPGAINLFYHLQGVSLNGNGITTVERFSFDNLQNLRFLVLSSNPIIYISKFAFRNLLAVNELDLSQTRLTFIPHAITTLPSLLSFKIGPNITCACGPHWMKQWANSVSTNFYLEGHCKFSNERLIDFFLNTIPNCP